MTSSDLVGAIPTEIGLLASLKSMFLEKNNLVGAIPTELGELASLKEILLNENTLTGSIPTELGHLNQLEYINLSKNQLTGTIPTELGRLTNLEYICFPENKLSGTIPTELGLVTSLEQMLNREFLKLRVSENACANAKARNGTISDFSNNTLTGPITLKEAFPICKAKATMPSSLATGTMPSAPLSTTTLPDSQSPNALIIGGVIGALVLLALAVAIGFCLRKKHMKRRNLPKSNSQLELATEETSIGDASTTFLPFDAQEGSASSLNDFLVSSNGPSKGLTQRAFPVVSKLSTAHSQFSATSHLTAAPEGHTVAFSNAETATKAHSGNLFNAIAPTQRRLPTNPKEWTQDQTAQWIFEKFGNEYLSSLALSQKINGRALLRLERQDLILGLRLETVGERVLFEEALEELRDITRQQFAAAPEDPPTYV
ncbi:hypothetical protein HDU77_008114 [Chytriomyces hyalinus]|nr:hypothetical protein HDU77_008114 [Chytriomyces hyalinus]